MTNAQPDNEREDSRILNQITKALVGSLQRDDGMEVSIASTEREDGITTVHLTRKPTAEATLYATPEGATCYDWNIKFERQAAGATLPLNPGELIRVKGFLQTDKDGSHFIHVDADGRIADNFYLKAKIPELAAHEGMPLIVLLKVGAEQIKNYRISNIFDYDAELVGVEKLPLVNPNEETVKGLPSGERVIVEGLFTGYLGKPANEWYDNFNSCKIKTDDGREIYLDLVHGKFSLTGGALENLERKELIPGDRIAIAAFVSRNKREPEVAGVKIEEGVRLAASTEACLLRAPAPERRQQYETLRADIAEKIALLSTTVGKRRYPDARKMIGAVRKSELVSSELDRVDEAVRALPEDERPVMVSRKDYKAIAAPDYWIAEIDKAYGIITESMTRSEFISFAREAATGKLTKGSKVDTSYLYGIAEDLKVDAATREQLMIDAIASRMPRLRVEPYDHNRDFDDKYMVEQSFKYLSGLNTARSVRFLVETLEGLVKNGEYHKPGWRELPKGPATFVYEISSSIRNAAYHATEHCKPYVGRIEAIRQVLLDKSDCCEVAISELERGLKKLDVD